MFAMGPAFFKPAAVAGPSTPTRITAQAKTGTTSISALAFDAVDIQAGDLLIAKWNSPFNRYISSVTDTGSGGTWAPAVVYSDYSGIAQGFDQIYYAIATTNKTGCVVTDHLNGSIDTYGGWLEVYRPPAGKSFTFASSAKQLVADTAQTPNPLPCSPITLAGNVLLPLLVGNERDGAPVVANGFDAGATVINAILNAKGSTSVGASGEYLGSNLSALVIDATFGSDDSGDNWALKDFLIAPFTYA